MWLLAWATKAQLLVDPWLLVWPAQEVNERVIVATFCAFRGAGFRRAWWTQVLVVKFAVHNLQSSWLIMSTRSNTDASPSIHDGWFVHKHKFVHCIMTMTLVCMSFWNPSDQAREKATGGLMSMQVVRLGFSWLQMNILVVSRSFHIIVLALHERDEECVFESSRVRIILPSW